MGYNGRKPQAGSNLFSQEEESEGILGTGLLNLDS